MLIFFNGQIKLLSGKHSMEYFLLRWGGHVGFEPK